LWRFRPSSFIFSFAFLQLAYSSTAASCIINVDIPLLRNADVAYVVFHVPFQ
jgi:hypothetical protein